MIRGFSFVEVMAALVILSISLLVLSESQTRSMNLISRTRFADQATTLASGKMVELIEQVKAKGVESLKDQDGGDFDSKNFPGFRWTYKKLDVPPPDFAKLMAGVTGQTSEEENPKQENSNAALFAGPLAAIGKVWGQSLKELHVEVSWGEGANARSYELVTHLIASNAVAQLQGAIGSGFGGQGGAAPQ